MSINSHAAQPSQLDAHIGFWMRSVSNSVSARFQRLLATEGASVPEWVTLRLLYDERSLTHRALIEALGMTKGAVSKILRRMENKGWVEKVLAEGSGREQQIMLTQPGRQLVPRLAALADANEAHFFAHIKDDERKLFMKIVCQLAEHHQLRKPPTD